MILSDLSVRRPVFATVLSLLLVILGLAALMNIPVRQYPDIDPPVVSIETTYRGASAQVVETKVTQVIEDRIAGIEKLTSTSREEVSSIEVEFGLDRDVNEAANDIRDRVARVVAELPDEADPPEIAKVDDDTRAVMGSAFSALLTLFVVPAFYAALARNTRSPQHVSRAIARLRGKLPETPSAGSQPLAGGSP